MLGKKKFALLLTLVLMLAPEVNTVPLDNTNGGKKKHGIQKRSLFGLMNFSLLFLNALLAINLNVNIPDNLAEVGRK